MKKDIKEFLWNMVTIPMMVVGFALLTVTAVIVVLGPLGIAVYLCLQSSPWYLLLVFLGVGWLGAILERFIGGIS